ncbi:hypothetical protein KW790_00410 [Candidatus Parcubacteria bacterium]|nr:hypothetical protein [Candidatus Parcubacteria bacterium]
MKKFVLILFFLAPAFSHATVITKPFEVSGWIPYWRSATGTQEALGHLDAFTEIDPFVYTVKADGTLYDAGGMDTDPWTSFVRTAQSKNVRVIPTIMSGSGEHMDAILTSKTLRDAHIQAIVQMVYSHNFDGVDIDYEARSPSTSPYYSIFLRDLYKAIGNKWVMCTIEARTPKDSLARDPSIPNSNDDYKELNKYCDRVRIMTYDQRVVDKKLAAETSDPYSPVADPKWVEKVMKLALQYFPKKKLMLGIATYGYEYEVTPLVEGYKYKLLWAFNPRYALDFANTSGVPVYRNAAGELSLIYRPGTDGIPPVANILVALHSPSFRLMWWSDAQAIQDKVALAKKLGIRGVSIFKIDGGADPGMWNVLE